MSDTYSLSLEITPGASGRYELMFVEPKTERAITLAELLRQTPLARFDHDAVLHSMRSEDALVVVGHALASAFLSTAEDFHAVASNVLAAKAAPSLRGEGTTVITLPAARGALPASIALAAAPFLAAHKGRYDKVVYAVSPDAYAFALLGEGAKCVTVRLGADRTDVPRVALFDGALGLHDAGDANTEDVSPTDAERTEGDALTQLALVAARL